MTTDHILPSYHPANFLSLLGSFSKHSAEQYARFPDFKLNARLAGIQVPQPSQRISLFLLGVLGCAEVTELSATTVIDWRTF